VERRKKRSNGENIAKKPPITQEKGPSHPSGADNTKRKKEREMERSNGGETRTEKGQIQTKNGKQHRIRRNDDDGRKNGKQT